MTRRGSSKFMEKQLPFTGILSNKAEENPGPLMINKFTLGKKFFSTGNIFSGKKNVFITYFLVFGM